MPSEIVEGELAEEPAVEPPKPLPTYACKGCGFGVNAFAAQCPSCKEWGLLTKISVGMPAVAKDGIPDAEIEQNDGYVPRPREDSGYHGGYQGGGGAIPLTSVPSTVLARLPTGLHELNRVLGGGFVVGHTIIVGGDPGIGKSTMLLQAATHVARDGRALYATAEERAEDIASRSRRLGILSKNVFVIATSDAQEVQREIERLRPHIVIFDSLQTGRVPDIEGQPGSVLQVKATAERLAAIAKAFNLCMVIVSQVTKDGTLAGPKAAEHLVDASLQFDGDKNQALRTLRANKNRGASTLDIGVFEMTAEGLIDVERPSAAFLAERPKSSAGSVVVPIAPTTSRAMLVEVQALATGVPAGKTPTTVVQGFDRRRVALIEAVLTRHTNVRIKGDLYVNVIGGLAIDDDRGADLGVALAIASAVTGKPVPEDLVVFGELGLTGELRDAPAARVRLAEAEAMGFKRAILAPHASIGDVESVTLERHASLRAALEAAIGEIPFEIPDEEDDDE